MIAEARAADHEQASILRSQINQAKTEAAESATLAEACRVERDVRAKTVQGIANQIASRSRSSGLATDPGRPGSVEDVNGPAETAAQSPRARTRPAIHQHHSAGVDPPGQVGPTLIA
jgi:hypothetical protein